MLHLWMAGGDMRIWLGWGCVIGLALAGCQNGSPVSEDEAEAHFRAHQERYARIVTLVDACRPARTGSSYNRVWADGSSGSGLQCSRGAHDIDAIEQALRESGAVSVSYGTEDGPGSLTHDGALTSVDVTVFSSGIVTSGTSIAFVYSPEALEAAPRDFRDGDYIITRRLVGPPPHHWHWRRGSN